MKKNLLTLLIVMLALPGFARDIEYTYEGQTLTYTVIDEEAKTVKTKEGDRWTSGNDVSGTLVIPSQIKGGDEIYDVTEIGEYAFYWCADLTSVTIPESVTEISVSAFESCHNLTSIIIPESVISIGKEAFYGCISLTSINIPESVISIDMCAFYGCISLTSVTIPASVKEIGEGAFYNCNNLAYAEFASIEALCEIKFGDYEANPLNCAHKLYIDGKEVTSVTIPEGTEEIKANIFAGCSGLISITIPETVTSIGEGAFSDCSGLTSIIIPDAVTEISKGAFFSCSGLTSVTIPESVKEIGQSAFCCCSGLTSITIPESVTTIGDGAFDMCYNLTTLILLSSEVKIGRYAFRAYNYNLKCAYPNTMDNPFESDVYAISFDSKTSIIDNYTIYGPERKSILFVPYNKNGDYSVPSSVTEIGAGAYSNLLNLTTIEIPNDVTFIGNQAFANCKALENVILPMKLETLGSAVFEKSSSIKNVVFNGPTPVESSSDVFDNQVYENATLYVCSGSQTLFMDRSPWKFFRNITDDRYIGIESVEADFNEDAPCEVFNLNGVKIADSTDNLPGGIYVVRQGDTAKKVAVK